VSKEEKLIVEINLLEWLLEHAEKIVDEQNIMYAFTKGVLFEEKLELKEIKK
jgi:hypothetical protein